MAFDCNNIGCPVSNGSCHFYHQHSSGEIEFCSHPANESSLEGNCTKELCPINLTAEGIIRVYAPWSKFQVINLIFRQQDKSKHEYTCPKCALNRVLIPTTQGFLCPNNCGYIQYWAWASDLERVVP